MKPLNSRQLRFAHELAAGASRVDAVYRAFGRVVSGRHGRRHPSAQAAAKRAERLLANPRVRAEHDALCRAAADRAGVSAEWLLREAVELLKVDPIDLFRHNPGGGYSLPRRVEDVPPHARRTVGSIEVETRTTRGPDGASVEVTRVRFGAPDKWQARALLWRRLGLDAPAPPLEAVLAYLPAEMREALRAALADRAGA